MKDTEKQLIVDEIILQAKLTSQNKIAHKIGVSTATISQMVNHNWKLIKADLWRKSKVNLKLDFDWKIVETENFNILNKVLYSVQVNRLSIGISENAGIGKSEAYKHYLRKYKNVIYVECKAYWKRKTYVKHLLTATGLDSQGTEEEMIDRFLDHLKGLENPIVIIDQADKLKDPSLDLFMDFYNDLGPHCAFVLSGVKALEKRILRGVRNDKTGYRELWSRIGSKFYDRIIATTLSDVEKICIANGVTDPSDHDYIFKISTGDLRKIRREIKVRQIIKKQAA